MCASGFRFDPPLLEPVPELCWLLEAAFGGGEAFDSKVRDPGVVIDLGDRLDLLSRIGARVGAEVLVKELGQESAQEILGRTRSSAGHGLRVKAMAVRVGRVAEYEGINSVIVKGGALVLRGLVPAGSRNVGDLDVLVCRRDAELFQRSLVGAGWLESDVSASRHQLPILGHKSGVPVEVHVLVPGVRLGVGDATAEDVLNAGCYLEMEGLPGRSRVADESLLLAHLITHGVHQHGLSPDAYPMARMLADVQDLVVSSERRDRFLDTGFNWIRHKVTGREVDALWAVVDRLGRGEDPAFLIGEDDDAGKLLRHVIAGVVDEKYRQALRLRNTARAAGDVSWLGVGRKAFFLSRTQIDIIYGKPSNEVGYLGWRLWRPFDLVLRGVKYSWAWLKHRVRRR